MSICVRSKDAQKQLARTSLTSGDATKTIASLSAPFLKIAEKAPAYKITARLEKKTEIKPVENILHLSQARCVLLL